MSLNSKASNSTLAHAENYLSIDDILATQEKIACKFDVPVYRLGYLDASSDNEDLAAGTKLELTFWLVRALCGRNKHTVSIELPKQYGESYRQIFSADATVVDLHKLGPYFYSFGMRILHFDLPDSPDVAKSLIQVFQDRFRTIMDASQNTFNQDTTHITEKLDETERDMFALGQSALNAFQKWESREVEKLATSNLVVTHRKRKRVQMEQE